MLARLAVATAALVFVSGTFTPATAQEKGDTGLTMGFPGSIGLLWHVTDDVAIRPEFTFSRSTTDDATVWTYGTGVSALFYLSKNDNVRTYFSPRLTFGQSNLGSENDFINADVTSRQFGIIGSFGAQYTPNSRFGVFGEVGFGYTHSTAERENGFGDDFETSNVSTRAGVGVIWYF